MLWFGIDTVSMVLQALGIALKLTLQGQNQLMYPETYYCILVRPSIQTPKGFNGGISHGSC